MAFLAGESPNIQPYVMYIIRFWPTNPTRSISKPPKESDNANTQADEITRQQVLH